MAVAIEAMRDLGLVNLKIAGEAGYRFDHRFGVDPRYPEAVSIIDKVLAAMTEQEHREIENRWIRVEYAKGVDYALVWKPTPEVFDRVRVRRAIFNLGAGVDSLLAVHTLPDDVPVVRLEDAGMAA